MTDPPWRDRSRRIDAAVKALAIVSAVQFVVENGFDAPLPELTWASLAIMLWLGVEAVVYLRSYTGMNEDAQ